MLEAEQRFGFAVSRLLTQICAWALPAAMPHEGPRRGGNPVPGRLEPPAHVRVVTGTAVLNVEAVDGQERFPPKRHVAAGNVFGNVIAFEDVHGLPRCGGDATGQPAVLRGEVRP